MMKAIFLIFMTVFYAAIPAYASDRVALGSDIATGWGSGKIWLKNQPFGYKPHGHKIVKAADGHPVRLGSKSIRFEVRPGDCGNSGDWDDCKNDRERHELSQKSSSQQHGDEYWFSWSIFIPEDTPFLYPTDVHLGQFHQKINNVLFLTSWKAQGYTVLNQVPGDGRDKEKKLIVLGVKFVGQWVDILVHARWSYKNDGFYRVYVNRNLKYKHEGQTLAKGDQSYFQFGIYRSWISRYMKAKGVSQLPTQVIYYDEVHRSKSLAKVDKVGIAELQKRLSKKGLYSGTIDGIWGPGTRSGTNRLLAGLGAEPIQNYTLAIWDALNKPDI